MNNSKQILILY